MKLRLIIPVNYKGEKLELIGKLVEGRFGFTIKVNVEGGEVVFEQDEEGNYRAVLKPACLVREGKIDAELVEAIKETILEADNK